MKIKSHLLLATLLLVSINSSAADANLPNNINSAANQRFAKFSAQTKLAPDALVRDLYKTPDSPFYQKENRALVDKYFAASLAETIWTEANEPRDGAGALDADPLYNAQDSDIKKLVVAKPKITGDTAQVVVSFLNFKKLYKINYSLVKEDGDWKISDINYGEGYTLVGIYEDYAKRMAETPAETQGETETRGEFEGKYTIGTTSCTVKPVKMAFEVKWEKGRGAEMFFFQDRADDKIIFASDPKTGKANVFSFDDESYNTGIFYRADGKEFPVKRAE